MTAFAGTTSTSHNQHSRRHSIRSSSVTTVAVVTWLAALLCVLEPALGHTWFTYPPAHYNAMPRNGVTQTPCEPYSANYKATKVKAGQAVHVEWAAMGHSGGYVRLSLVPKWWMSFDVAETNNGEGTEEDAVLFASNVLKYACFGGGDGTAEVNMDRKYGTDVIIPTNLKDGVYVLQLWNTGTGAAIAHSYSCTDLDVSGGDESIVCDPITMPAANDTANGGLDSCWSCLETHPWEAGCKPPHQVEGGFGFKFGAFCFPDSPERKVTPKNLIGFASHEIGPGDTLMGVAVTYQCCCTPSEIAVTTGWGDSNNAIREMEQQTIIAGLPVIIPFYENRRGCTPAKDILSAAPPGAMSAGPATLLLLAVALITLLLAHDAH